MMPVLSVSSSPLKFYVFVGDSSGQPNCDRFCHRIDTIFGYFFIYSLFSTGESPSLVKNVEVEFEIIPRHSISRENNFR